jgi:hypothetical protein
MFAVNHLAQSSQCHRECNKLVVSRILAQILFSPPMTLPRVMLTLAGEQNRTSNAFLIHESTLAVLTIDENQFQEHQARIACFITRLTVLVIISSKLSVAAISTAWLSELTLALLTIDDNQFTDHQA